MDSEHNFNACIKSENESINIAIHYMQRGGDHKLYDTFIEILENYSPHIKIVNKDDNESV